MILNTLTVNVKKVKNAITNYKTFYNTKEYTNFWNI